MRAAERIVAVRSTILDVPLRREFEFAGRTLRSQALLIVQVYTSSGAVGLGEGSLPLDRPWSGQSIEVVQRAVDRFLGEALTGLDVSNPSEITETMAAAAPGHLLARSVLEAACMDAWARSLDLPLHALFGGARHLSVPVTWLITASEPSACAEEATAMAREAGYSSVVIRLSRPDPFNVVRVCRAARMIEGGPRLHVNLGHAPVETTATVHEHLADAGISLVEEPVAPGGWETTRILSRTLPLVLGAEEATTTPTDVIRFVARPPTRSLSVHPNRSGGLRAARLVMEIAQAAGIPCRFGTLFGGQIGTAAAVHLACCLEDLPFGTDLFGPTLLAEPLVQGPLVYRGGRVHLPRGPGNGLTLDPAAVKKYARR